MLFCSECGSILTPKEDGKKSIMVCENCGFKSQEKEDILIYEKVHSDKKLEVVNEKEDVKVMPKIKQDCPKCNNKMAYFWTVQTRAGDEAETKFFQCTKCDYRWREYE